MSITRIMLAGVSLAVLAACGQKEAETEAVVPSVEEVEKVVELTAEEQAAAALEKSEKFLAKNAKADGVQVQESGLQFEDLETGEGPSPGETDFVTVHYTGRLLTGEIFDSSVERGEPVTLQLVRVVDGWKEGLQLMKQGGKARLVLPPDLAYGEKGTPDGSIGPNEAITFEVELIEVIPQDNQERLQEIAAAAQQRYMQQMQAMAEENTLKAQAFLAENVMKEDVNITESGLQYTVLIEGDGDKSPKAENRVVAHYRGTKLDGSEFDSSYSRGEPTTFPLQAVIPGWTEGLQLMNVGDKYRFYIPPNLAYGLNGRGPIGPNELLIFDVELVDVLPPEEAKPEPAQSEPAE